MTEMEKLQLAKNCMDMLAQGIDPASGQKIPEDSLLNSVRLAGCFSYVAGVLEQVIDNGGEVRKISRGTYVTAEELQRVKPAQEPLLLTQFVRMVIAVVGEQKRKRLNTVTIKSWLIAEGFLDRQTDADGGIRHLPTAKGVQIGLSTGARKGLNSDEYQAVLYSPEAQQFLLDHIPEIID